VYEDSPDLLVFPEYPDVMAQLVLLVTAVSQVRPTGPRVIKEKQVNQVIQAETALPV
jgi:hypothetical protein